MSYQHTPTASFLPLERHTIFQNSLMTALLDGIYDGQMTTSELLGHGNFGIGTFDALDGEMLIIDGICWQLNSDGTANKASLSARSPFAVVTNFVPRITASAPARLERGEVSAFIDGLLPSDNFMYAVKITGRFSRVDVRTVSRQHKPYPPMTEATGDDAHLTITDTTGVVAGFRTPVYERGISVPGCHVHFIDDARTTGGHILDFVLDEGLVEICPATDLNLRLPTTLEFGQADLAPDDTAAQIEVVENKKPRR
ncbi:acetolactate decarboxylase [Corynebacterium mendelii]|uniref:Alpha-acetolactate decarboxylase n=1 Tax=Corynebacterium mendelii TaxID=2765362 RepID=A0A939E0T1_9CORY|nr:acetolactate decarboxylase [Corynebacterium mendelii]MBN9644859.1 acetolactate decarboxylase [Corynebacterium mendelii]